MTPPAVDTAEEEQQKKAAEEARKLSEIRGDCKRLIRKLKSKGNEIISAKDLGASALKNPLLQNQFVGMHAVLSSMFDEFQELWDQCLDYCEIHNVTFPATEHVTFSTTVKACYYEAKGFYLQLEEKTISKPRPSFSMSGTQSRSNLPRLHLTRFGGTFSHWTAFKQLFVSLVKDDPNLSPIEQFHYLLSYLEGPALDVIKAIELKEENFDQAWNCLCKAYDDKRKIANSLLDKLFSHKPSTGRPSYDSLQSYISHVSEPILSLQNLQIPNFTEYLLCELALRVLDPHTRHEFEISSIGVEFPTFKGLTDFVQGRCQVLRLTHDSPIATSSKSDPKVLKSHQRPFPKPISGQALLAHSNLEPKSDTASNKQFTCFVCKKFHKIRDCPEFRSATPAQRLDALKDFPGCKNCLFPYHKTASCTSKFSCKWCNKKHHKDLHLGPTPSSTSSGIPLPSSPATAPNNTNSAFCGASLSPSTGVLLGTVRAQILDAAGNPRFFRGVLDAGSHFSFITVACAQGLGKTIFPFRGNISGVNHAPLQRIAGQINISFKSASSDLTSQAIVVPSITPPLPHANLSSEMWFDYQTYDLSDPEFFTSSNIQFLIGADLYPQVVIGAPITIHHHGPKIIETVFGFVVMGKYSCISDEPLGTFSACLTYSSPEFPIEKFWQLEEPLVQQPALSEQEKACEQHFVTTHYRLDSGRYGVRLPFKTSSPNIRINTKVVLNQFYSLERKLSKNQALCQDYNTFMAEYLELGHMSIAKSAPAYLIPHHPVYKFDVHGKGKLRVVFNGSFPSPTGSLNHHLLTGPKLQADLSGIILNFRRFRYVLTCDGVKMFRQVEVHPDDRKYQVIVWRFNESDPISYFELNRLVYGITSSPYQSLRATRQLVADEGADYPLASEALDEGLFVDDIAYGADSPAQLFELKSQLVQLMAKGCFELAKWHTNYMPLLSQRDIDMKPIPICEEKEDHITKILGMAWDPCSDTFKYELLIPTEADTSKRQILSVIARLFDPLGYLAPIIFYAKTILQETWKSGVNWDEQVPAYIKDLWSKFILDLPAISLISIPRHITTTDTIYRLIGFSDASEQGYCGVLYLHSTQGSKSTMDLIKAKTKLAPLKTISIPRLELQGALLLTQLIKSVDPLVKKLNITDIFCFTDSQVALTWIKTPPYQLKTFVANRVQQIMDITQPSWWYHIRGIENPADCGSRGMLPSNLYRHDLWWSGPAWCQSQLESWPISQAVIDADVPELKPTKSAVALATVNDSNEFLENIERYSSYLRLIRVTGYVRRFIANARIPKRLRRRRKIGPLSATEFQQAQLSCIRLVQEQHFPEVYSRRAKDRFPKELERLAIFLDHQGIIRVGGRLSKAPLCFDQRNPILLPTRSHFTNLIVDHLHRKNRHPGPTALMAFIRQQFWIPRARNLVRLHKMKCVTCTRYAKLSTAPLMGDLPHSRVYGARAFLNCGIDMAGPFICKDSDRRNAKTHKAYLCLFICLASRAVHLELCNALSVESFLDAFERFSSRRGVPSRIQTDCGTNFVGAARYLNEIRDWIKEDYTRDAIIAGTHHLNVAWYFNPPASPHMGGSWESAIKSVKTLLHKTLGTNSFSGTELNTMFVKIEGILNSRPLVPLSTSPDDPEVLTPGHFTIGQPPNALPEPDLTDVSSNRLSRWQLIRERVQHFWNRWRDEYLTSLQVRAKWERGASNLKIGDIVLVKSNTSAPAHWPMARIIETHPGADSIVRVVTLKTTTGIFKRSSVNLIPLPINDVNTF